MEYTKGEWKVIKTHGDAPWQEGRAIVCDKKLIADLSIYGGGLIETVVNANAYLIAAAPDMYKALKQAERTFEAFRIREVDPRMLMITKALAKAEGK